MGGKNLLKKVSKNERGMTLVELLIGVALLSMVLAVGYTFYSFGYNSFTMGESRSLVRQNIRLAADFITQQLRYATYVDIIDHVPDEEEFNDELDYIYVQDGALKHKKAGGEEETVFNSISEGVVLDDLDFTLQVEVEGEFLIYEIRNSTEDDYSITSKLRFLNQLQEVPDDGTPGMAIAYKSLPPEPNPDDDFIEVYPDVFVPNEEIPPGEIMVFKGGEFVLISVDELKKPNFNSEDHKIEGSLYIPESTGEILISDYWPVDETIDWTVTGDIIVGADIEITKWTTANIVSREGDIIFLEGSKFQGSYEMDIQAEQGGIVVDGSDLSVVNSGDGIIRLAAKEDISLTNTKITSPGSNGVVIISENGKINANGANIVVDSGSNAIVHFNSEDDISMINAIITTSGDKGILRWTTLSRHFFALV